MRLGFRGSNLKYYRLTFLILIVFAAECTAINWDKHTTKYTASEFIQQRLNSTDDQITKQWILDSCQYMNEKIDESLAVSIYLIFIWAVFLFLAIGKFKYDFIDEAYIVLFMTSAFIDARDHLLNLNTRPDYLDWQVFLSLIVILFIFKLIKYPLIRVT